MKFNEIAKKWGGVVALVAIIALVFFAGRHQRFGSAANGGNVTDYTAVNTDSGYYVAANQIVNSSGNWVGSGTVRVGASGTASANIVRGTCYIKAYAATIAASSTANVDCQGTALVDPNGVSTLAGVQFGDGIVLNLSTTTAGSTFLGLHAIGVIGSTTNGYIRVTVANLTGTTFTWPTGTAATGTASFEAFR